MTDSATKKALCVSTDSTAGPYIRLPFSQLDEVRQLLDSRHIGYWVEENVISFNGAPEVAFINLGRGGDAAAVQAILDSQVSVNLRRPVADLLAGDVPYPY
jgi:hypothetical protein